MYPTGTIITWVIVNAAEVWLAFGLLQWMYPSSEVTCEPLPEGGYGCSASW